MSDKFQIHLQGTAETQQWIKAEGELRKLDTAATQFLNSLKQGVGIDLGGKLVNGIGQLQGMFTGLVMRGFDFNKTMVQTEGSIGNVLAEFMHLDAQAAKQEAAKAMKSIVEWEPKAAGTLQDLTAGFMATVAPAQAAGLSVAQNVELVGRFANALANSKIPADQLAQEMRAILTGNITVDAQFAKMRGITPEAIQRAKEAGTLYDYLILKIGKLGTMGKGPDVVLSNLSSAINKATGALAGGLFDEVMHGAEELTTVLDDPAIKEGLKEVGVDIRKLVAQGINLSLWAVQNAPLLLRVAEGALRVGSAIAAIKLTTILAGLMLKAQRWSMVTAAVTQNTAALAANSAAATVNAAGGGRNAAGQFIAGSSVAAAGNVGGVTMATGWAAGFKGALGAALPLILLGLTMKLMEQGGEIMGLLSDWQKQNDTNSSNLQNRQHPTELLRDTITHADKPEDVNAARRLGQIMQRDAKAEGNEVLLNQINAIMGKFDELVGKQVDHKKATDDAAAAEKAFASALLEGQAAAGDSAAKIDMASSAVENLAQKLSKAAGSKIDTSSFESLVKSLQGLDKAKLGEEAMKDVAKLIELAGKLRDLKADAAKEAEQQADKQKKAAEDLRQAEIKKLELQSRAAEAAGKEELSRDLKARADALKLRAELEEQGMTPETAAGVVKAEQGKDLAKKDKEHGKEEYRKELARQVADLEDEIAAKRAAGDKQGEQAAQDRLSALQLARQLEDQLGLSRDEAEARANTRIENERAASDRDEFKSGFGKGNGAVRRPSGPARLSSADTWGDSRKGDGLRGDGGSSVDAFNARQTTPQRDAFNFPALDAFASNQPAQPGAGDVTPQKEGSSKGDGSNVASAAQQAADAASKLREASAKSDAALLAEFQKLTSELQSLASQQQETSSQVANNRA